MSNNYIFKYRFLFFHINQDIFQTRNLLVSYNTHKFHVLNASILPFLISFFSISKNTIKLIENLTKFTLQTNKFLVKKNGFKFKFLFLLIIAISVNLFILNMSALVAAIFGYLGFYSDGKKAVVFYCGFLFTILSMRMYFFFELPKHLQYMDLFWTVISASLFFICYSVEFVNPDTFSWIFFLPFGFMNTLFLLFGIIVYLRTTHNKNNFMLLSTTNR